VAEWRSGWHPNLLRGIRHIIVGEEQHRAAKVACQRNSPELQAPSRVLPLPRRGGPSDWTSEWDPYRSGGDGIAKTLPCGQTEGGFQGRSRTLGRASASAWPARRIPTRSKRISPENIDGQRQSHRLRELRIQRVPIENASHPLLRECAKNRRRTRGA